MKAERRGGEGRAQGLLGQAAVCEALFYQKPFGCACFVLNTLNSVGPPLHGSLTHSGNDHLLRNRGHC